MAEELRKLNVKRGAVKRQLTTFFNHVKNPEYDISQLRERYNKITEIWEKFEHLSVEIECIIQESHDENALQEHIRITDMYEQDYYESMATARQKLETSQQSAQQAKVELHGMNQNQNLKIKLPALTIHPFSGKYEQWLSFKDSFIKAVHEQPQLPDVQKFQILRGLLKDDALGVISALEATDANYKEAWSLLENRYSNTRLIINTHVKGLFDLPAISKVNYIELRSMIDTIRLHVRSLKSLGEPVDEWNTIVIFLIMEKVDNPSKEDWEREVSSNGSDSPTLEELLKFLEKRCLMLEMVSKTKQKPEIQTTNMAKKDRKVSLATIANGATSHGCSFCNERHEIYKCDKFLKLSVDAKNEQARKLKLCINCLKRGHQSRACRSSSCRKCSMKHNTLLHKNHAYSANESVQTTTDASTNLNQVVTHCLPKHISRIVLSTARVYITDINGIQHECRALLDPGSQVNILKEDLWKKLGLQCSSVNIPIAGVQQKSLKISKSANIKIQSTVSHFSVQENCLISPTITERIPQVSLNKSNLIVPDGIELADPDFMTPGTIDLLIGAGIFWKILIPGETIAKKGQPTFQKTKLGWIVGGELKIDKEKPLQASCNLVTSSLHDQIEQFWKIEELSRKQEAYKEQNYCEKHFLQTYTRDADGRFEVELPQNANIILGESYDEAFRRLKSLERRFQKQPELKKAYIEFLADYEAAGHMSGQEEQMRGSQHYYMPHQPVIITAKMIMQELWKCKMGWDENVPKYLQITWKKYLESLTHIPDLKIRRNVNPRNKSGTISLHGFCDASERAYGACVYVLSTDTGGQRHSNLLCSKSKVAPLKKITLPRLELCAALLLARLLAVVTTALKCNIVDVHLWSDSTIVLNWIMTPPIKKTFEAHRVTKIHQLTKTYVWHHILSKENPADLISRGAPAAKLKTLDIWWYGPPWLTTSTELPLSIVQIKNDFCKEDIVAVTIQNTEFDLLHKYSKFSKLQRVVAYCYKYKNILQKRPVSKSLTHEELEIARKRILIWVQAEAFPQEVTNLRAGKPLDSGSKLLTLNPYMDQHGLILVGGRLRNAEIPEEQKHQVIIPSKHHVTHIIFRDEHIRLMHCGPQQLLYSIRQRYWPLSGGHEARKITRSCVACFKYKPRTPEIVMGDLPASRVNVPHHPFQTTGVDYAGPLAIRESKRRGKIYISKGYIAVFTCFTTKAVHLELVTDLSTEAFMAALRRFIARRGLCSSIYSDNATNFVGAARELKDMHDFIEAHEQYIKTDLSSRGITWNFIPPRSPHFGGIWESAVKSIKKHLYTVTKGLTYTFEEYYTLLAEIEAILNSRPLMPMSSDPNDLSVLTPAHFLIGTSLREPDGKCYLDVADNHLSRWQHIQKLKHHFWKRWRSDYLNHLQVRSKWRSGTTNLQVGTMVLLVDDNQPPRSWSLGRVVSVIPGTDQVIRVADVRTQQGIFRRALRK